MWVPCGGLNHIQKTGAFPPISGPSLEWPGGPRWVAMETECRLSPIAFLFARS